MAYSNLSLMLELPQQSSTFQVAVIGALGIILGAIFTGLLGYAKERKNKLLEAYSQLIGKKFTVVQEYQNILQCSIEADYNKGMVIEAENFAKLENQKAKKAELVYEKVVKSRDIRKILILRSVIKERKENAEFYLDQIKDIQNMNTPVANRLDKNIYDWTRDIEGLWSTIGTINGIIGNDKNVNEFIENIRKEQDSLNNFLKKLAKETEEGLTDLGIDDNERLYSPWKKNKEPEVECHIDLFERKIESLINYLRDNEINKHWLRFLW